MFLFLSTHLVINFLLSTALHPANFDMLFFHLFFLNGPFSPDHGLCRSVLFSLCLEVLRMISTLILCGQRTHSVWYKVSENSWRLKRSPGYALSWRMFLGIWIWCTRLWPAQRSAKCWGAMLPWALPPSRWSSVSLPHPLWRQVDVYSSNCNFPCGFYRFWFHLFCSPGVWVTHIQACCVFWVDWPLNQEADHTKCNALVA